MANVPELLSIGEVADRTGVSVSALRFYEAEGMVTTTRSPGGQRRFPRDVLRRVAFIRVAQRVGLTLDEIRGARSQRSRINALRPRPTGPGCRAPGSRASMSESGCSRACATISRHVSAVAACRCTRAGCTTPKTAPGRSVKDLGISSATPPSMSFPSWHGRRREVRASDRGASPGDRIPCCRAW